MMAQGVIFQIVKKFFQVLTERSRSGLNCEITCTINYHIICLFREYSNDNNVKENYILETIVTYFRISETIKSCELKRKGILIMNY